MVQYGAKSCPVTGIWGRKWCQPHNLMTTTPMGKKPAASKESYGTAVSIYLKKNSNIFIDFCAGVQLLITASDETATKISK